MACVAVALLLLVPVLPVRIYPPWTTPPSSH
jgi:MFS transporter, DHA2 family, multidrug resistance protein